MSERQKRNVIIISLCGVLLLMVVGYAAFNTLLTISGITSITSNWNIKITNIQSKDIVGNASDEESQVVDDLTATFNANLVSPGDSITYDITVENKGNINAYLGKITINKKENPAIIFEESGLQENDELSPNTSKILTIKVTYNPDITEDPEDKSADFTVELDFSQELWVAPTVVCPSGCTVSGNSCSGTVRTTLSDFGTCDGGASTCNSLVITDSYSIVLNPAKEDGGIMTIPHYHTGCTSSTPRMVDGGTCPDGYVNECSGGNCYTDYCCKRTCSSSDVTFSCPEGYRLEEEKCYKE